MNVVGKFSLGLGAALVLNLGVRAESAVPAAADSPAMDAAAPAVDNSQPYATIVARNIFGLVPVPPPPPPAEPLADPPPKITANGIMTVFGDLQALFKVSEPGKGGQPAKDQSYMLSEGQRQDDIEVIKIDVKAATITFNNHGTQQEIPLETAKDSGPSGGISTPGAAGPPPGGGGFNPAIPRFRARPGMPPGGLPPVGNPFQPSGNNPGLNNLGNNDAANGNNSAAVPGFGATGTANPGVPDVVQQAQENTAGLTPEQQAILIETERASLLSQQDQGQTPSVSPSLIPPTRLNPQGSEPDPASSNQGVDNGRP